MRGLQQPTDQSRAQRGQTIPILALAFVVLCAFMTLAIDTGSQMAERRNIQAAVDGAAAAAMRSAEDGDAVVNYVAMRYLYKNLGISTPWPSWCNRTSCDVPPGYTVNGYTIDLRRSGSNLDVGVNHTIPTFFGGVLGVSTTNPGTSARVAVNLTCSICVLNESINDALTIQGKGNFLLDSTITGEGIVVNSSSGTGCAVVATDACGGQAAVNRQFNPEGSGTVKTTGPGGTVPPISVVGGYVDSGIPGPGFIPSPVRGPLVTDPLALLQQPEDRPASDGYRAFPYLIARSSVLGGTVSPGLYDELGLTENATGPLILEKGVYIIRQRFFQEHPHFTITNAREGVMIYLACAEWPRPCATPPPAPPAPPPDPRYNGAGVKLSSNGNVTLSAMGTTPGSPSNDYYRGMLFFMDRNNTVDPTSDKGKIQLSSAGLLNLTGTIYGKSGYLSYTSNRLGSVLRSAIVMDQVRLESVQDMLIVYNPAQNSPWVSRVRNRGLLR
jgi:hypothetical protein